MFKPWLLKWESKVGQKSSQEGNKGKGGASELRRCHTCGEVSKAIRREM